MAIVKFGAVVGGISGRVGGVVFAGGRSGAVLKAAGRRVGGDTQRARLAQSVPDGVATAWNALTDQQRGAWRTAAASVTRTNRLGMGRQISGWQLYWSVCATRYGASPPAAFLPPASLLEVRPAWLNASWWSGGPYVIFSYGAPWPTTAVTRYVYVHRFRKIGQQGGFDRPVRVAVGTKAGLGEDVYAAVVAAGVGLVPNEGLGVGVRWQISTGVVGGRVWVPITMDLGGAVIEDWETGDLASYTGDTTAAAVVTLPVYGGQAALKMISVGGAAVTKYIGATNGIRGTAVRGLVTECYVQFLAGTVHLGLLFGLIDTSNCYYCDWACTGVVCSIFKRVAGVDTLLGVGASTIPTAGTWYKVRLSWSTAGVMVLTILTLGGVVMGTVTVTDSTYTSGGIGFMVRNGAGLTGTAYFDNWTVTAKV